MNADPSADARRVMILDANVLDVMKAERALRSDGYHVAKLSSPNTAVAKIEFEQPEILLVDVTMEALDLEHLLTGIRKIPTLDDLVVVFTADLESEALEEMCRDADVHGYYCKSMDLTKIAQFLDMFYDA